MTFLNTNGPGISVILIACGTFYAGLSEVMSKDLKIASSEIRNEILKLDNEMKIASSEIRNEILKLDNRMEQKMDGMDQKMDGLERQLREIIIKLEKKE
jgi:hypothetical protein